MSTWLLAYFTPIERLIMELMAEGLENNQISSRCQVKPRMVKQHREQIVGKWQQLLEPQAIHPTRAAIAGCQGWFMAPVASSMMPPVPPARLAVASYLPFGYENHEIARSQGCATRTVNGHLRGLLQDFACPHRAAVACQMAARGWVGRPLFRSTILGSIFRELVPEAQHRLVRRATGEPDEDSVEQGVRRLCLESETALPRVIAGIVGADVFREQVPAAYQTRALTPLDEELEPLGVLIQSGWRPLQMAVRLRLNRTEVEARLESLFERYDVQSLLELAIILQLRGDIC